jgi:hypothetical protein
MTVPSQYRPPSKLKPSVRLPGGLRTGQSTSRIPRPDRTERMNSGILNPA